MFIRQLGTHELSKHSAINDELFCKVNVLKFSVHAYRKV